MSNHFAGSRNREDSANSSGDLPPTEPTMDKDSTLPADDAVCSPKSGSQSLMESLQQEKVKRDKPSLTVFSVSDTDADRPQAVSPTVRPLPKALQPKESRRGAQPGVPVHVGVYKAAIGCQLSSGINVSDSVLQQQRRRSSSGSSRSATSPTTKSPTPESSPVSAKQEVVLMRLGSESGGTVVGRRVVTEPNAGLATLRAMQRQQATTETTSTHQPEVKISPIDRYRSMPFNDVLSIFESPSTTTRTSKPKITQTPSTASRYSVYNRFASEVDEPASIVTEKPLENSVSASKVEHDPSPTISRLMIKQQTAVARTEQKRLNTQQSCPEPIPVIQVRKTETYPSAEEGKFDDSSITSTTSDSTELSCEPSTPEIESVWPEKVTDMDSSTSHHYLTGNVEVSTELNHEEKDVDQDEARYVTYNLEQVGQ